MSGQTRTSGFTIVELLIVIVVIGILAAITIVAFNGVQQRARTAALQSDIRSMSQAIEAFKIQNGVYPASPAAAGANASSGNQVAYSTYESAAGFCLQLTNGDQVRYKQNNSEAKEGVCANVTNIVTNPSLETGTSLWAAQWFGANGGNGTNARTALAARCGSFGWRKTWTTAGGSQDTGFSVGPIPVVAGRNYQFAASIRASYVTTHRFWVVWQMSSGTEINSGNFNPGYPATSVNEWSDLKFAATAPANAARAVLIWGPYPVNSEPGLGNATPVGATLDGDCASVIESNYAAGFADGASGNWTWTGTPNASTSTGPAY